MASQLRTPGGTGRSDFDSQGFSGGVLLDTDTGRLVPIDGGSVLPVVPEPLTLATLTIGLGGLGTYVRRRKYAAGGFPSSSHSKGTEQ